MKENSGNIDNFIKNQLDSHEFPYDGNEWLKLEEKISTPGKSQFFNPRNFFIASAVTIGIVATVLLVNQSQDDKVAPKETNKISEKSISDQKVSNVTEISNNNSEKAISTNENKVVADNKTEPVTVNNFREVIAPEKQENRKTTGEDNKENTPPVNCNKNEKGTSGQKLPCAGFRADKNEGCAPVTVKFTPFEKCDTAVYLWDFGDGTVSSDMIASHTFTDAGKYDITLTVKYYKTEKIISKVAIEEITVLKVPEVNFSYESSGGKISFTAMSDITNRFNWNFGDGLSSREMNPEHVYTNSGDYKVTLKVEALNGCDNSYQDKITVDLLPAFEMPDAFTPNGDGRNDYFGPVVNDLELVKFEMEIYNKLGQMIYKTTSYDQPWDGRVMGSNKICDAGVYVWRVKTIDKYGNSKNSQGSFTLVR